MRDSFLSLDVERHHALPSARDPLRTQNSEKTDRSTSRESAASTKRTALVVDDISDVTEMLSVLLSRAGYAVVTAASAPQALNAANEFQFDVVISDIGMPGMNGYQLAHELRQLPGYENVPLVAVTGYSMFDDRERSKRAGFNAHMTKPIDPSALLELIEQL